MTKLLKKVNGQNFVKDVKLVDDPGCFKPLLNNIAWKIIESLSQKEQYPSQIAVNLKIHEQKIYYHIRQLEREGIISVSKKVEKHGSLAKYYSLNHSAFAIELIKGDEKALHASFQEPNLKVQQFFYPFIRNNLVDLIIVVGSPDPHGPHQVRGRDGASGIDIAAFLGQYGKLPGHLLMKLDVDIMSQDTAEQNMILIGGPLTNILTSKFNQNSLIQFETEKFPYHRLHSITTGKDYADGEIGCISKFPNPANPQKSVLLIAGVKFRGTMSAILALTRLTDEVLKKYNNEEKWATIVRGKDLDGDGKIDSVDIVE